jgi:hypothetical protein
MAPATPVRSGKPQLPRAVTSAVWQPRAGAALARGVVVQAPAHGAHLGGLKGGAAGPCLLGEWRTTGRGAVGRARAPRACGAARRRPPARDRGAGAAAARADRARGGAGLRVDVLLVGHGADGAARRVPPLGPRERLGLGGQRPGPRVQARAPPRRGGQRAGRGGGARRGWCGPASGTRDPDAPRGEGICARLVSTGGGVTCPFSTVGTRRVQLVWEGRGGAGSDDRAAEPLSPRSRRSRAACRRAACAEASAVARSFTEQEETDLKALFRRQVCTRVCQQKSARPPPPDVSS